VPYVGHHRLVTYSPHQRLLAHLTLMNFTTSQIQAIEHDKGNLVLFAVAGSGKTTVLVERIRRLSKMNRSQLVLTFSKRAAETLTNRVGAMTDGRSFIGTFHSFCYHVMRRRKPTQYKGKELLQAREDWMLIAWAESELKDRDDTRTPSQLVQIMTGLKTGGHHPDTWLSNCDRITQQMSGVTHADVQMASRMQTQLEQARRYTFDDMLVDCLYTLDQEPQFGALLREHFDHIMVDEFQDTDPSQGLILQHLVRDNLCVVGDDDQAIYSFRGCSPAFILRFEQYYGASTKVAMEENFRSEEPILTHANALIGHNTARISKVLRATRGSGGLVNLKQVADAAAEAAHIADLIVRYKDAGYMYQDIAVLYRTNAQSGPFEDELTERGIPFLIAEEGGGFYDRTEIKTLINYLRIVHDPRDISALRWVLNRPTRFLRRAWVAECARESPPSTLGTLRLMQSKGNARQQRAVTALISLLTAAQSAAAAGVGPAELATMLWRGVGYDQYLCDIAARSVRAKSVDDISGAARQFVTKTLPRFTDLAQLMAHISRVETEVRQRRPNQDAVQLTTVHRAKGLEFPVVVLSGLNNDLFPHKEADIVEERRLAYVAVTRAVHALHITTHGTPSSFITELGLTIADHDNGQPIQMLGYDRLPEYGR